MHLPTKTRRRVQTTPCQVFYFLPLCLQYATGRILTNAICACMSTPFKKQKQTAPLRRRQVDLEGVLPGSGVRATRSWRYWGCALPEDANQEGLAVYNNRSSQVPLTRTLVHMALGTPFYSFQKEDCPQQTPLNILLVMALPSVSTATEDFMVRTYTTLRRHQGMVLTHSSGFTTTVLPLTIPRLQFSLFLDIQPSHCLHFSTSLQRQMNAHKASKASR